MRTLEQQSGGFGKKLADCESSCKGLGNLSDKSTEQIQENTRNLIQQDLRIKNIEERLRIENPVKDSQSPRQSKDRRTQPNAIEAIFRQIAKRKGTKAQLGPEDDITI